MSQCHGVTVSPLAALRSSLQHGEWLLQEEEGGRAVNETSQSFTMPRESPYLGLLLALVGTFTFIKNLLRQYAKQEFKHDI